MSRCGTTLPRYLRTSSGCFSTASENGAEDDAGLVTSTRGANGGYRLSRSPHEITAADVIDALEGPLSITECSGSDSHCDIEGVCNIGNAWQRINVAIRHSLDEVTLFDLLRANCPMPSFEFAGMPITLEQSY